MRLLSALLLSGLFAGIAAAPAARCAESSVGGAEQRATTDAPEPAGRDEPEDRTPDAPRFTAAPGPALKGPDERDRSDVGVDTGARHATPRRAAPGAATPNARRTTTRVDPACGSVEHASRTECRAGHRPLPPPPLLRA